MNLNETRDMTRISSKGQITIPTKIRQAFKIKTGQTFTVHARKNGILIKPVDIAITDKTTTSEWDAGLQEALEEVKAGRTQIFKSEREFFEHLDRLGSADKARKKGPRK